MSKLHYFDRPTPDADDAELAFAIQWGLVPPGCLLGGTILYPILELKKDPCKSCAGPRQRCGGRPRSTAESESQAAGESRMRSILLGEDASAIDQLLNRR